MSSRNVDKTPAHDEMLYRKKKEAVELCGKNRGPHDYIPIEWMKYGDIERVTRLMCRVCFVNISMNNILNHVEEVSY